MNKLTDEERQLINAYRLCNDKGKERILLYISDITGIKRYTEPEDSQGEILFLTGGIES